MNNELKGSALVSTTAKDFFLYLAFIVTLVWLITSFFMGSFSLIDAWLPDPLYSSYWYTQGVSPLLQSAIASLITVTPFFLVIAGFINRTLRRQPEKKDMWVRKWMLYALLFIAFVVALTDLVLLSNSFFQGELTSRFALKSLLVLVVSASVFSYFFYDLRRDVEVGSKIPLSAGIGVGLMAALIVILGFVVGGSPSEQRAWRLDGERVSTIQQIVWEIESYIGVHKGLPESLSELEYFGEQWFDPVTGEEYGYQVIDEDSFEICANFAMTTEGSTTRAPHSPTGGLLVGPSNFEHSAGVDCFEYRVRDWDLIDRDINLNKTEAVVPKVAE